MNLMSIVVTYGGRVLINRIVSRIGAELRREQAGFRKGRSTTEQIFVRGDIEVYMYEKLQNDKNRCKPQNRKTFRPKRKTATKSHTHSSLACAVALSFFLSKHLIFF